MSDAARPRPDAARPRPDAGLFRPDAGLSRRRLLGAAAVGGSLAALPGLAGTAHAAPLDYRTPAAFDVAEQAFLDLGFTDNEAGGYAWGASYYLLGLMRMYQTYGDVDYLDRLVRYADQVWASTDAARGVTDHRGVSGPVWRAGGNYTASHGTLRDADGTPLIQVRWASTQPTSATAEITEVSGDRFTLTLAHPNSTLRVMPGLSLDPADDAYVLTAVAEVYRSAQRWSAIDLRRRPAAAAAPPTQQVTFEQQYYPFAVHTGMVTYPIAMYVRMILESDDPQLRRRRPTAMRYLRAVERAVAFHDHEFEVDAQGRGEYRWPFGAPVPFDGLLQPHNQSQGLGQTMTELFRITGRQRYADAIGALITSFRGGFELTGSDGYVWPYWPVQSELYNGFTAEEGLSSYTPSYGTVRSIEDISHAAISLEFLTGAHAAGLGGLADDLPRFARTYTTQVVRSDDEVWYRVDGTTDAVPTNAVQCARWGCLGDVDPAILAHALRVWDAVALEPAQGSHALAIAYLNRVGTTE